jgi:hypothetical protein
VRCRQQSAAGKFGRALAKEPGSRGIKAGNITRADDHLVSFIQRKAASAAFHKSMRMNGQFGEVRTSCCCYRNVAARTRTGRKTNHATIEFNGEVFGKLDKWLSFQIPGNVCGKGICVRRGR